MQCNENQRISILFSMIITIVGLTMGFFFLYSIKGSVPFQEHAFIKISAAVVLAPIGAYLFYIVNFALIYTFTSDPKYTPVLSVCLSGGIILSLLAVISFSYPEADSRCVDPRNRNVEIRSVVLYTDSDGVIHDHPFCSDFDTVEDHRIVSLNDLLYDSDWLNFEICYICNYVWYDEENNLIHSYADCINIPDSVREDVQLIDSLFGYAEYGCGNLCPYCY